MAGQTGGQQQVIVIAAQTPLWLQGKRLLIAAQTPAPIQRHVFINKGLMAEQIVRALRRTTALQILGAGTQHNTAGRQRLNDHSRYIATAFAQGQIDTRLQQIDIGITEINLQFQLRMLSHKGCAGLVEKRRPQSQRCRQSQGAVQAVLQLANLLAGLAQAGQHLPRRVQVQQAGLGQHQAPGRTLEQARPKFVFQMADRFGQRRWGLAQLFSRATEAAQLGSDDKHIEGTELVHLFLCGTAMTFNQG